MIREAVPEDRAKVEALLLQRIDGAMFPLTNLRAHGLMRGRFPADHDTASRFWWLGQGSLVAVTRAGMLMPLLTAGPDIAGLRQALAGLTVTGGIGPADSLRPVLAALGLDRLPMRRDADEPGFALALAELVLPDHADVQLVPAGEVHRPLLQAWRSVYQAELMGTPAGEAAARAAADVEGWLRRGSHRLLLRDGQPVALTGFNAILPEVVQVGGVYTPPALRGQGHARRAVALHLAEARAAGTARAVLFAASPAAARAYRAIGFRPIFAFTLALLARPVTIAP
jgi:RimJ/RimL family protein N-acetyltransferase